MANSFSTLMEKVSPCPVSDSQITDAEARDLITKFQKVFGIIRVDFSFSFHALVERMTHPRNKPPISKCEFDYVMTQFVRKQSKQLQDDVWDIENNKVQKRGRNPDWVRAGNYEYTIISRSTGINIALALQPNPRRGGNRVRVNIITIMRKYGFKVKQGETVMVENTELNPDRVIYVD